MPVLREIFNQKEDYRRCELADVSFHFYKIAHWIPEEEKVAFMARMVDSIQEKHAWQSKNTFLYYTKENERQATGIAIFGMDHPVEMLSLFTGVFYFEDRTTAMLRFALHPDKMIKEYKSMLTVTSMQRAHADRDHPLMIRVDAFRQKMIRIIDKEIKK